MVLILCFFLEVPVFSSATLCHLNFMQSCWLCATLCLSLKEESTLNWCKSLNPKWNWSTETSKQTCQWGPWIISYLQKEPIRQTRLMKCVCWKASGEDSWLNWDTNPEQEDLWTVSSEVHVLPGEVFVHTCSLLQISRKPVICHWPRVFLHKVLQDRSTATQERTKTNDVLTPTC